MSQYSTFRLGDRLFGLDLMMIREINRILDITPVPEPVNVAMAVFGAGFFWDWSPACLSRIKENSIPIVTRFSLKKYLNR